MTTEVTEGRPVTARVRCVECQTNYTVAVPRVGEILMVPARFVHIACGNEVKIMSAGIRKLMNGSGFHE